MVEAEDRDSYSICPNAFGGFEVQIQFAAGGGRRHGSFDTETEALVWINRHGGLRMVRTVPSENSRASIGAEAG